MRRGQVLVILAVSSGMLSVLLAVAVNIATGGTLPEPLDRVSWLAWPSVGLLAAITVALTVWQQRLAGPVELPATNSRTGQTPAELPAAPSIFAGRADDQAAIDRLLADCNRVLALVGPPGVGKSALALRIAHDVRNQYPDGQLFAVLRGAGPDPVPPEAVLVRFLGALGVPEDEKRGSIDDLAARWRSALAGRRVLIVLDDAHDTAQVAPTLPGDPGCLILVTSRRILPELPGAASHPVGGLDQPGARALLADIVGEDRIATDPDGVARLLQLCGGLPLAVRIAGARLRARPAWTATDMANRLADERHRLDELHVGNLAVRSTFDASYRELSAGDRRVFRRAGSHPGRVFGVGAASALAGLHEIAVSAAMERLVDVHLADSPTPNRYRLHDLLRLFATERLSAEELPADRVACMARLLDWFTSHARPGEWLAQERDNVLATVRRAVDAGAHEQALELVDAVHPLLTSASDNPDRLALWLAAERAATALSDDRRRGRALRMVSTAYLNAGEVAKTLAPAEQAADIAKRLDDPQALAEALRAHGEALRDLGRFTPAEKVLSQALDLFNKLGDIDNEIDVLTTLATLHNTLERPASAVPMAERAVALLPGDGGSRHGWTLLQLSIAYKHAGRREEAATLLSQVFALAHQTGDDFVLAYALQERGWLAHRAGRYGDATRDWQQVLAICQRIHHSSGVGGAHESLGAIALSRGRNAEAITAFDAAIAQFKRLRHDVRTSQSLLYRAEALAAAGRIHEARTDWAAADLLCGDDVALPDAQRLRERLHARLGTDPPCRPTA